MIVPQANALVIKAFGGMSSRMSPYLVDDRVAVESENVNMLRGVLEPLRANEHIRTAGRTAGLVAYGRDKFVTLNRQNDGHVVIGPRIVFADSAADGSDVGPRYIVTETYDDEAATPAKYRFGMPDLLTEWLDGDDMPISPFVGLEFGSGGEGILYHYAISVANRWGDESALSLAGTYEDASTAANLRFNITLDADEVDALRTLLDGHELDTMKIRVYRSVLGTFLQVHEGDLPAAGTAFAHEDRIEDDPGPSKVNDGVKVRIPDGARGFVWHPNGFMACHTDDYVYFSSPLSLSHFPEGTRVDPHGGKIVALEEYGNRIIIFFENGPPKTIESITLPGSGVLVSPEIAHRTISGASVAKSANGVYYASRDGIVVTNGIEGRLLEDLFDADSFNRYAPFDIRGYATDLDYYAFGPGRENFLLQRGGMMTHLDEEITDMSQWSDHVYALVGGSIVEMFASREQVLRQARWRSKKFEFARPTLLKSVKMSADYDRFNIETVAGGLGIPEQLGEGSGVFIDLGDFTSAVVRHTDPARLSMRVIKDDHQHEVPNVRTSHAWNLPEAVGGKKSTTYQIEITTNTPVYSVGMAPNVRTFDMVPIPTASNVDEAQVRTVRRQREAAAAVPADAPPPSGVVPEQVQDRPFSFGGVTHTAFTR